MENIKEIFNKRFALQQEYLGDDKIVNSIKPLVSVSVVTYQHAPYILDCLNGILMQKTSFPFEIIIGEDESTDGTRALCTDYAEKHPDKVRLFLRDRKLSQLYNENGNFITKFNTFWNILSAKGKYIALCDGDDYWTDPFKLQKQVEFLEDNEEYVLCFHDSKEVDKENKVISRSRLGNKWYDYSKDFMLGGPFIPDNTVMFRNIFDNFPVPEFLFKAANDDTVLWHLLGFYGGGKFITNIDNSVYRLHDDSVWSSITIMEKIKKLLISRTMIKNNLVLYFGNSHITVKEQKKRLRMLHRKYLYQLVKKIPIVGNLLKSIYNLLKK